MQEHLAAIIIPLLVFLFVTWLIHRIESRTAREAIYNNFPFFKDAVNSFQMKLDYLITRVDALEERIRKLELRLTDLGHK